MTMRVPVALGWLVLAGCGYVGEPKFPALNIPVAVNNLAAVERGDKIVVQFLAPALTTEDLIIKEFDSVDLRVGVASAPFSAEAWAESATKATVKIPAPAAHTTTEIPVRDFIGKDVVLSVRTWNTKGRASAWSNFVSLHIREPLLKPATLQASAVPEGVRVHWHSEDTVIEKVYRQGEKDKAPVLLATVEKPEYLDTTTEYGKSYAYFVQGLRDEAETEVASTHTDILKDTFPPAVPTGVTAAAGSDSIELAWERNSEPDFQGYNVYRSSEDGGFEKLVEKLEGPSYSDRKIEAGKHYRYAVSAADRVGNESGRSTAVEAVAP